MNNAIVPLVSNMTTFEDSVFAIIKKQLVTWIGLFAIEMLNAFLKMELTHASVTLDTAEMVVTAFLKVNAPKI